MFEKYWGRLVRKNPKLDKPGSIKMSTESFKRRLQLAYEEGSKENASFSPFPFPTFNGAFKRKYRG